MGKQVKLIDRWAQDSGFEILEENKEKPPKKKPQKTNKAKTFNQIINGD